jgi:competence protein ComFC
MRKFLSFPKKFLLDLFFPRFCFGCQKEGNYLCRDCQSTLGILSSHQNYSTQNLKDLYFAVDYRNPLVKNLIQNFKYGPFIKELAKTLSSLILEHFQLLDNQPNFSNFILIPVPLEKRRLRWRGFNQAEEIGKELSSFLKIPLFADYLAKIKQTLPKVELSDQAREENIENAFEVKNKNQIFAKKILLVDDVLTTGSTLEECARVLKKAGAKEIVGIVIARG